MIERFNVRVYFILLNDEKNEVLVSDEIIKRANYTKFPGGGLEYGEGISDCVHREALEELGQDVVIIRHFYTTDFFVQSAFRQQDQVISIYYLVTLSDKQQFVTSSTKFQFRQNEDDEESFRWVSLSEISPDDFAFPADKKVVNLLVECRNEW